MTHWTYNPDEAYCEPDYVISDRLDWALRDTPRISEASIEYEPCVGGYRAALWGDGLFLGWLSSWAHPSTRQQPATRQPTCAAIEDAASWASIVDATTAATCYADYFAGDDGLPGLYSVARTPSGRWAVLQHTDGARCAPIGYLTHHALLNR
jgi:hypothetical protein